MSSSKISAKFFLGWGCINQFCTCVIDIYDYLCFYLKRPLHLLCFSSPKSVRHFKEQSKQTAAFGILGVQAHPKLQPNFLVYVSSLIWSWSSMLIMSSKCSMTDKLISMSLMWRVVNWLWLKYCTEIASTRAVFGFWHVSDLAFTVIKLTLHHFELVLRFVPLNSNGLCFVVPFCFLWIILCIGDECGLPWQCHHLTPLLV